MADFSLPPPAKPGDPILPEHVLTIMAVADRLIKGVVAPLHLSDGGQLTYDAPPEFWALITGAPTGLIYPFLEQYPATGGTWTNGNISGDSTTIGAYEDNGSTTDLTGKYVWMRYAETANEYRFQYGPC